MKRTPLKRKSKSDIKKLQDKLWEHCKRLIRARDKGKCFTCDAVGLTGSNAQCGHFIPSSTCGAYLRFSLDNLALQCMRCNIHNGGMGAEFYRRLVEKKGQEFVDQLFHDKQRIVKAEERYKELLSEYEKL